MKKAIAAALLSAAMALTALPAAAADALTVGTEALTGPFAWIDSKTGDFTGYDIALMRELCRRAGFEPKFENLAFDALIPALATGSIDVVIADMTITETRKKRVDFSDPYYETRQAMLVREADAAKLKDLAGLGGRTIAVQLGSTGALLAQSVKGAKTKTFSGLFEAFMDLKNGGSDAVIIDAPGIDFFIARSPHDAEGLVKVKLDVEPEYLGICVKKGRKGILDRINRAIAEVRADGTYDKIYREWFGDD